MIILNATNTKFGNYLPYVLGSISIIIFLIAASPGYLDIYYKEVSFEIENGVAFLKKEYGVLHHLLSLSHTFVSEPITLNGVTDIIPFGRIAPGLVVPKFDVPMNGFT